MLVQKREIGVREAGRRVKMRRGWSSVRSDAKLCFSFLRVRRVGVEEGEAGRDASARRLLPRCDVIRRVILQHRRGGRDSGGSAGLCSAWRVLLRDGCGGLPLRSGGGLGFLLRLERGAGLEEL